MKNPHLWDAFCHSVIEQNKITTPIAARDLAYDPNSQLVSATNPEAPLNGSQSESFVYDGIHNRTSDQDPNHLYRYTDLNKQRLLEDWRYFYFYDNNGNLISKQAKGMTGEVTNYKYSSENQLLQVKAFAAVLTDASVPWIPVSSAVKEINYTYDATGRRIQKSVIDFIAPSDPTKTFTRRYVYNGGNILLEYDGSNHLLAKYTHSGLAADDILAVEITDDGKNAGLAQQSPGSKSYFYLKDQLGSVTDIVDNQGSRLQHYVYSSYGELLQIQNGVGQDVTQNPVLATSYMFAGREYDRETSLYYNRARYYDPSWAGFCRKTQSPGVLKRDRPRNNATASQAVRADEHRGQAPTIHG
ncbi:MAG: RHS repeat-associated core domain-containing protein [Bdellovibrionota bacterium]